MQGSYHVGNTASRPISEVKQRWALLVLAWETSLEPSVTLRFFPFIRTGGREPQDQTRGDLSIFAILYWAGLWTFLNPNPRKIKNDDPLNFSQNT